MANHEINIICPGCGNDYDARLHLFVCPNCGYETNTEELTINQIY